jgi:hypothetical protein
VFICGFLVFPDPVAFLPVFRTVFGQHNLPAIIRFVPADGIEQEFSTCRAGALRRRVIRAAITQRLTTNDVFVVDLRDCQPHVNGAK